MTEWLATCDRWPLRLGNLSPTPRLGPLKCEGRQDAEDGRVVGKMSVSIYFSYSKCH